MVFMFSMTLTESRGQDAISTEAPSAKIHLSEILTYFRGVKNISVPIGSDCSKPALIFTCQSIKIERKSVGIFRIGILPEVILCNVTIRLKNSPTPSIWAESFGSFLESGKPQNFKIRNLRIETSDNLHSISADEATIPSLESGIVLKNVTLSAGDSKKYKSASIDLQGIDSGHIKISGLGELLLAINDASIEPTQKDAPSRPF